MNVVNTIEPTAGERASAAERTPLLVARRLTKVFGSANRAVRAVEDVDLVVHGGEVVALLGPNGAGKTTIIKMAAGLVTPTRGTVSVLGHDLVRRRGEAVRHLGAVLEGGRNVYWALSAWQNLIYFGRLRGLRSREIAPRAEWLLRELGLWARRREAVGGFSRGMQQKVAIAAALVSDPAVLLLDEPTIGLDVSAARTVKDWVRRLAAEQRKAVVLTTHQLAVAQELSDRVAVINQGRIIADRPVGDLLAQFREDRYHVQVAAEPDDVPPSMLFEIVDGDPAAGSTTLAVGAATDNGALYEVLGLLAASRVPLVSVTPVQPDLEEVFVRLVGADR
ncbi:MAG TPA: ABC transporter ATP-binding protein [Acidimicrobiales bacterium]|nr:ABC transporter ATP-binding protein [Acidimicrobiales bacterium]